MTITNNRAFRPICRIAPRLAEVQIHVRQKSRRGKHATLQCRRNSDLLEGRSRSVYDNATSRPELARADDSLPRPRRWRLAQNSVLGWDPLDVLDHQELDLHIAALEFQSQRFPKRAKEIGFRRGNVGTWGYGR
jgi:hypothetical protein